MGTMMPWSVRDAVVRFGATAVAVTALTYQDTPDARKWLPPKRYPGEGNRRERRKAAALRRRGR